MTRQQTIAGLTTLDLNSEIYNLLHRTEPSESSKQHCQTDTESQAAVNLVAAESRFFSQSEPPQRVVLDTANERAPDLPALDAIADLFDNKVPYTEKPQLKPNSAPIETEIPSIIIAPKLPSTTIKDVLLHRMIHCVTKRNRTEPPIGYRCFSIDNERIQSNNDRLIFCTDKITNVVYMVDSGCQISIIPKKDGDREDRECKFALKAANGTTMKTYGTERIKLRLGNKYYRWTFLKADVTTPIIGIDFLRHHQLLVDPSTDSIIDKQTGETISCSSAATESLCLSLEIVDPICKLLESYPELTTDQNSFKEQKHDVVHYIRTVGGPIKAPVRHYNPAIQEIIRKTFHDYLEMGIVRYSDSNWSSPLAVVPKSDGSYRVCGDYRGLNKLTQSDNYALPYLASFNSRMHGARIFSKIDLVKAYHQIGVFGPDIHKTAVATPVGTFEFMRMPFGLKTAGQTFQRFIDSVMRKFVDFSFCYLDDVIVFSKNIEEHRRHLKAIFGQLAAFGLKLNLAKSEFAKTKISFLGFEVDADGVRPDQAKVEAIRNMPVPQTYGQMKRYLGMITFYCRHIRNFASIRASLNVFLSVPKYKNNQKIDRLSEQQLADFQLLNQRLANAALLYHPRLNTTLTLHCDASSKGVGSVLTQYNYELEQFEPLFFFSKSFSKDWEDKSIFKKELEAAFLSVKRLYKFLIGQKTILFTDNLALFNALNSPKDQPPVELRKMQFISQYVDEFHLVDGKLNLVADTLSRMEYDEKTLNALRLDAVIDYRKLFEEQMSDEYLQAHRKEERFTKKQITLAGGEQVDVWHFNANGNRQLIYVPNSMRTAVVDAYHKLFHPGQKSTSRLVAGRFYWPELNADVRRHVQYCLDCQRSKKARANQIPVNRITANDERFRQIHIDLVGPLPVVKGYQYIMTFIDRCSRFVVAQPVQRIDTISVWNTLLNSWVKYFGCPGVVTADRGRQFDNRVFRHLCNEFGIKVNHTTAFHPASNGLIEREHSKLKASLRSLRDSDWVDRLPIVILGWNNALREDYLHSPSQLLYGNSTRLPVDFFEARPARPVNSETAAAYVAELNTFRSFKSSQHAQRYPTFKLPGIDTCSQVWVRNEIAKGLEPVYTGPFKVISRKADYFTIDKKRIGHPGEGDRVHISRLKPAFILSDSAL